MSDILLIFTIIIGTGFGASGNNTQATNDTAMDTSKEDWQPEPQVPSGKFTTAVEVKPILTATKASWAALREYEGKDLLYLTNLLAWRCGVHEIRYAVNGAPQQVWEMEECHLDTAQPNGLTMENHLPYISLGLGSVNSVSVMVTYDDGSEDSISYQRSDILMP